MLSYHPDRDGVEGLDYDQEEGPHQKLASEQTYSADEHGSRCLDIVLVVRRVTTVARHHFERERVHCAGNERVQRRGGQNGHNFGC